MATSYSQTGSSGTGVHPNGYNIKVTNRVSGPGAGSGLSLYQTATGGLAFGGVDGATGGYGYSFLTYSYNAANPLSATVAGIGGAGSSVTSGTARRG